MSNGDNAYASRLTNDNGYIIYTDSSEKILLGYNGNETSLTLPNDITKINQYAFYNCASLTSIIIGENVISIGYSAFEGCTGLASIEVDANNTAYKSIDGNLFSKDGKTLVQYAIAKKETSYVVMDSVISIGDYAFYGCSSLATVTIGNNVTTIGNFAFYGCSSLTTITIGNNVTTIGEAAFYDCCMLVEITNHSQYITVTKGERANGFVGYYALEVLNGAGTFVSRVTNENGYIIYTNRGERILLGYTGNETSLTLPNDITKINKYAFYYCASLTSITIGDSVTTIENSAFYGCTGLTSITIGGSIKSVEEKAFAFCYGLTDVIIGKSVTKIDQSAFYRCECLLNVYYQGSERDWGKMDVGVGASQLTLATRYYYSETAPALNGSGTDYDGNYWHYDTDGKTPVIWVYQKKN